MHNFRYYIDLSETVDPVLYLIKVAEDRFGRRALYGGNCGMFALALAQALIAKGAACRLYVVCQAPFDSPAAFTPNDITAQELSVYHVAVALGSNIYDGDGLVTRKSIGDWVEQEYSDDEPFEVNFGLNDRGLERMIRNDTAWNISSDHFLALFRGEVVPDQPEDED